MKTMKKLLALLLTLCTVLGFAVPAAGAADVTCELADGEFTSAGTYNVTLLDTADVTVFSFCPEETGVYRITTSTAGAVLHTMTGSAFFLVYGGIAEGNSVTYECKNVGPTCIFGISGADSAKITIELDENAQIQTDPSDLPWTVYEPTAALTKFTLPSGNLTYVDVTERHTAVLGDDGYYHLDSWAGEILFVNLTGPADYVSMVTMASYGQARRYFYDEDGTFLNKVDYSNCITEYSTYANKGIYPMTADLITIMQKVGEDKGWYDKDGVQNTYLFGSDTIDESTGWMFNACYISGYGATTIVYGDANGDGEVNGKDLLMLRRYMANYDDESKTSTINVQAGADANGDGEVNGKDLLMLRRYMANYDDESKTSTVVLGPKN